MDKADKKQDKKMIADMVHTHEGKLHPGKPKTKFAKGGPTTDDRMKFGRNLSRANNQGSK
jgi:hypothetical protein